jgi:hypothetical protein
MLLLVNPTMSDLLLTTNGRGEEDYDVISDRRLVGRIFKPRCGACGDAVDVGVRPFTAHRSLSSAPRLCGHARAGYAGLRKCLVRLKSCYRFCYPIAWHETELGSTSAQPQVRLGPKTLIQMG